MNEHPIIFNVEMVRGILAGRKTQTRRVLKVQPMEDASNWRPWLVCGERQYEAGKPLWICSVHNETYQFGCPYGQEGSRLWVRETWRSAEAPGGYFYRAAATDYMLQISTQENGKPWRPSIHMPRAASRLTLEVLKVRVERVQDISEEDAQAEGVGYWGCDTVEHFQDLWDSINAKRGYPWSSNPWVWVIEFRTSSATASKPSK